MIDALTEMVSGTMRTPDGRIQYRMNIGTSTRQLVTQDDLTILLDRENLVIMVRQKEPYRRSVTERLHSILSADRFIKSA